MIQSEIDLAVSLAEHSQAIVQVLDAGGRIISLSPSLENIVGEQRAQLNGRDWFSSFIPEQDRETAKVFFRRSLNQKCPDGRITPILAKNGAERKILWFDTPLKSGRRKAVAALSIGQEVTEPVGINQAVEETELYYRSLLDCLHDNIMVIDGDYRITDSNCRGHSAGQESRDVIIGKKCHAVSHGSSIPCSGMDHLCPHKIVFETGQTIQVTHRHLSAGGEPVWMDITASPLRNPQGEVVQVIEVSRDITEIMKSQQSLRESEERYRTVVESSFDGIVVIDEREILYANPAYLNMLGYTLEELKGLADHEIVAPEYLESSRERRRRLLQGQGAGTLYEVAFSRKNGERVWAEGVNRQIIFGGRRALYTCFRDITERKRQENLIRRQNEELTEANRLKDEFLYAVSHELRTPLTAIIGWAELLTDEKDGAPRTAKLERGLRQIKDNAFRLKHLVEDLMDLAFGIRGELKYSFSQRSINSTVKAAVDRALPMAQKKNIKLNTLLSNNLPKTRMDARRIEHVVWNLLRNALKFSPPDASITIRTYARDNEIVTSVADQGPGIDARYQNAIFEPFRQIDGGMTRKYGGAGIGLALSKKFIEAHGGRIWMQSGPSRGSTFSFTLPLAHGRKKGGRKPA